MNKTLLACVSHAFNIIFVEGIISYIFLVLVVLLLLPLVKLSRTELNLFFSVLSWFSLLLAYTHTVLARYTRGGVDVFFSVLSWFSLLLADTHTVLARYTRREGG